MTIVTFQDKTLNGIVVYQDKINAMLVEVKMFKNFNIKGLLKGLYFLLAIQRGFEV